MNNLKTHNWCKVIQHDIEKFSLGKFIDENKKSSDGSWWNIYETRDEFSEHTHLLRQELESMFNDEFPYMGMWDYYPGFVDDLGPHFDQGTLENAVVFMVPRGELTVTLHDPDTKEVLESKVLSGNNIMALHHTKFMHDVKGVGELIVFGLSKNFDADKYFKKI
tara:strand:+ start:678 stop:1169 length:492 start_codon:yes stop_codon:yes gene_type:complete